jgi:hypothetical protein
MTATLTQVIKQFQQGWANQLAPEAIRRACRDAAYRWRERTLDPVTTIQVFFVQILHGNTACTHLRHLTKINITASAYCQACMKLPLTVFQQLLARSATPCSTSHSMRGAGSAIAPFGAMAPVFPWLTRLHCKTISANPANNCRGAVSPLRTS